MTLLEEDEEKFVKICNYIKDFAEKYCCYTK
jgi:hypothetical protein